MSIKKDDRLMLLVHGAEVPVVAASDEHDGSIQIKQKGTFSTVNVTSVRKLDWDAAHVTGHTIDVNNAHPPCPTCGNAGISQPPHQTTDNGLLVSFRCPQNHEWSEEYSGK